MKQKENVILQGFKLKFRYFDWKLLAPYLLMMAIGVIMVYSSSSYMAMTLFNNSEYFFIRQLVFAVVSLGIVGFLSLINHRIIKSKGLIGIALVALFFALLYLIVVGFITKGASATNGASAWMNIGTFGIQPTEFLKIAMILYLAVFFSNNQQALAEIGYEGEKDEAKTTKFRFVLKQMIRLLKKPLIFMAVFLFLVMLQPDMGGVIIIGGICFVMFLLSGIRFQYGLLAISGVGIFYTLFIGIMKLFGNLPFMPTYMAERFTAFLDPFQDMQDSSFQLVNSFYALARGGMFGVGLGESVQKSGYLPESHTDFIISITAEELGLVGVVVVLTLFFYLVYRIYRISLRVKDSYSQLVCIGIATMFLIQGTINVGGAIGILPLTGVTFPFMSYGGSSILVSSVAIGIIHNISIKNRIRASQA
ncbi:FtsW/RodA/SpoVE family cell cycle protein [Jeotgalibaca caeni]|uniref:FtsW/RodA/SpoVE family cell cycle protein n=1 Tax=Jeotgalibaca caeni TaxID=3028623 RepID=UPI00237D88AA|nr:putative peptidoglycan glycosyltransferase FtsW [Jeotgalibaca caeni]MDE1549598.1 putative peptidoglycan glycosyltransferase FtsW [Jeotgalibaca caeni]